MYGRRTLPRFRLTESEVLTCCASRRFANALVAKAPFESVDEIITSAQHIWWNQVDVAGWLEAFAAHPRIGDIDGLKMKYGGFAKLSEGEQQAAISTGSDEIFKALAEWNNKYESKFGHIFIICASGKSALEMLESVQSRYPNSPAQELTNAAREQMKITELRLRQLFSNDSSSIPRTGLFSPITCHVLDTARGTPAHDMYISLYRRCTGSTDAWETLAEVVTNEDGRVGSRLPPAGPLQVGRYKMVFHTGVYLNKCRLVHPTFYAEMPFYPTVEVQFDITTAMVDQHFHIPLLLSPYGYSTYRGS